MSEQFDGRFLAEIAALELPHPEDFILNSSASLAERGIIDPETVGDIDGTTSLANLEYLRAQPGWHVVPKTVGTDDKNVSIIVDVTHDKNRRFDLHEWDFSVEDYQRTGKGRIQLDEQRLWSDQDPVTGIYVARPEYSLRTKRGTGRDKDALRVQAIEEWQQGQGL